jgi:hypothetical protein
MLGKVINGLPELFEYFGFGVESGARGAIGLIAGIFGQDASEISQVAFRPRGFLCVGLMIPVRVSAGLEYLGAVPFQ